MCAADSNGLVYVCAAKDDVPWRTTAGPTKINAIFYDGFLLFVV